MYKVKNNMVAIPKDDLKQPTRSTRKAHKDSFIPLSASRDYRKYTFFPRTIVDWNELPKEVTSAPSLEIFSKQLDLHLKQLSSI